MKDCSTFEGTTHSISKKLLNIENGCVLLNFIIKKKTPWSESASELYRPSNRRKFHNAKPIPPIPMI
jgi:hypothetical protein